MGPAVGIDRRLLDFPLPEQSRYGLDESRSVGWIDKNADPFVGHGVATATARSPHDFQAAASR